VDTALLRSGRLEHHIKVDIPNSQQRRNIIEGFTKYHAANLTLQDMAHLTSCTHNFSGADIECMFREAALTAIKSNSEWVG
jgi:ATP-dependent 26S proteasome regulatory subunit